MNGAFGFFPESKLRKRTYMSDVVKAGLLQHCPDSWAIHPNDFDLSDQNGRKVRLYRGCDIKLGDTESRKYNLRFHYEKGGIWRAPDKRIIAFIGKYNQEENCLFVVGKSYGCLDVCEILLQMSASLKYKRIHLLLVDPAWIGSKKHEGKLLIPKCVDEAWCVFQRNKYPRGCEAAFAACSHPLHITQIKDPSVDHFNIVTHDQTKLFLGEAINGLCEILSPTIHRSEV
jgi:hypothetical protein